MVATGWSLRDASCALAAAACNLIRVPKLLDGPIICRRNRSSSSRNHPAIGENICRCPGSAIKGNTYSPENAIVCDFFRPPARKAESTDLGMPVEGGEACDRD